MHVVVKKIGSNLVNFVIVVVVVKLRMMEGFFSLMFFVVKIHCSKTEDRFCWGFSHFKLELQLELLLGLL
jgi:hypothetical protein